MARPNKHYDGQDKATEEDSNWKRETHAAGIKTIGKRQLNRESGLGTMLH